MTDNFDAQTGERLVPARIATPSIRLQEPSSPPVVHAPPTSTVNVHVSTPMVITQPRGLPFIVRTLWYLFVGWWLTALVITLGYVLIATIIGIPVAFALFNRIPQFLTLRMRTVRYGAEVRDGITYLTAGTERQRPWYWRTLYFLVVGWWFGLVWLVAAWLVGLLILTLPVSFLMYNRTGGVMTLQRH